MHGRESEIAERGGATPDLGHEFRTPLNAVIGLSESLLSDTAEPLTPDQSLALAAIRAAGLRLLGLVETEIDSADAPGPAASVLERIDVGRAARHLCETLRDRLAGFDVRLCEPDADPDAHAAADPALLRRSLHAMIAHILAECRPGAEIVLTVRRGRDFVEAAVAGRQPRTPHRPGGDTRPFSAPSEPRSRPLEGAGLPEARRLALAMNGRIERGCPHGPQAATFAPGLVLLLPPAGPSRAEPRPAAVTRSGSCPRARPIILYVEDHPANVMLMRRVLSALGDFDLYVGETGPLGLTMAQDIQPDLILLDINLPGLNGFDVMAALASQATTRAIPVVAVTANASVDDRRRGRAAGFAGYLTKPLDVPALAAILNRVLGDGAAAGRRPTPPPDPGRIARRA